MAFRSADRGQTGGLQVLRALPRLRGIPLKLSKSASGNCCTKPQWAKQTSLAKLPIPVNEIHRAQLIVSIRCLEILFSLGVLHLRFRGLQAGPPIVDLLSFLRYVGKYASV